MDSQNIQNISTPEMDELKGRAEAEEFLQSFKIEEESVLLMMT